MKKIYLSLFLFFAALSVSNAQVVINEVYGGGGNNGATWKNDFIELINNSTESVTLTGASIQYASATGAFNGIQVLPEITLLPGQTYLIQQATGTGGTQNLPQPDFMPTSPFNMSGTAFKVALANNTTAVTSPTSANVIDFVGVGSANIYEGAGAAPATSNTNSVSRTNGIDTDNNAADFTSGIPTPKNSLGQTTAPVNMLDFNFSKVDKTIKLTWRSAQEKNAKEYIVERSADNQNWTTLASVAAAGNTSSPTDYTYTDVSPLQNTNFYRLKMVDLDGSFEYYKTLSVNLQELVSVKLYPNPVKDMLYLQTAENTADLQIDIYNTAGNRMLSSKLNGNAINVSKLPSGVYFVKITKANGAAATTLKIVKL